MRDHPLRIMHAPLHGVSATPQQLRRALSFDPCSVSFSESYPLTIFPFLIARPSYPATVGKKASLRPLRGPHDTPILRRRHHRKIDSFAYKAVDSSIPIKIAPERWNTGVAYRHSWGRIGHITAHPNAVVQGLDPRKVDRVAKYVDQMTKLEKSIREWQRLGYWVVVTGDLNHHEGGAPWGPEAMFSRLNMRTWRVGVDWIAYDHRLWLPEDRRLIITDNGQDHPWMVATFRRTSEGG